MVGWEAPGAKGSKGWAHLSWGAGGRRAGEPRVGKGFAGATCGWTREDPTGSEGNLKRGLTLCLRSNKLASTWLLKTTHIYFLPSVGPKLCGSLEALVGVGGAESARTQAQLSSLGLDDACQSPCYC